MGLASLTAEWVRSLDAGSPARGNAASVERSSGRFGDYLAEMRSARRGARPEHPEPSLRSEQPKEDEPAEPPDKPAAEPPDNAQAPVLPVQPVVPPAAHVEVKTDAQAELFPSPADGRISSSTEVADVPSECVSDGSAVARLQESVRMPEAGAGGRVAPTEPLPMIPAAEHASATVVPSNETQAARSMDAAAVSEGRARRTENSPETLLNRAEAATESPSAEQASRSRATSLAEIPSPEQGVARRAETPIANSPEKQVAEEAPLRPAALPDHQPEAVRRTANSETIHDRKIKASIAERREGGMAGRPGESSDSSSGGGPGGVNRDGRSASSPAGQGRGAFGPQEGAGSPAKSGRVTESVTSDRSDATAALSARTAADAGGRTAESFDTLTAAQSGRESGSADAGRPRSVDVSSFKLSGATAATAGDVGSMGVVGRTLGDLLTTGLTGPDGPASAARVLGASATGPGRFQMTVQLEPPELGQVRLRIQMQQQVVSLHIDVENRTVARLIQSRMSELHDALAAQGVRVDRTDVVVRSPASGDAGFNQQPGDQGGDAGRTANDAASGWTAGGFHGGPSERGAGEGGWDGGAADEPWTADPSGKSEEPAPAADARWSEASLDVMA